MEMTKHGTIKGANGRRMKTEIGFDFPPDYDIPPYDVLRIRILQQAMVDYAQAYKHVCRIKKFPRNYEEWTPTQRRSAYSYFPKSRQTLGGVIAFLHSKWFGTLYYGEGFDPDRIEARLKNKCRALYGKLPSESVMNDLDAKARSFADELVKPKKGKDQ